ncbi:hypothetical protein [Haliea sp. E17]|uniref:hypothetical protein n=1 Tax=Haliea sp. E17 TaxID=3401576 RepID=UPI003AAF7D41
MHRWYPVSGGWKQARRALYCGVLAVTTGLAAGCGGGSGGDGDGGIVDGCGSWPELTVVGSGTGHSAVSALVVLDDCNVVIAGYEGSTRAGQVEGDSHGFVRRLTLSSSGVQVRWERLVDTSGSDAILTLERDGEQLLFTGFVSGTLEGQTSQGKKDVVIGSLDLEGRTNSLSQLGNARPNVPLRRLVLPSGEQLLVGNDEVYVPTNFVERWEDPWIAGITEQASGFVMDWIANANTDTGDIYGAALAYDYTALLGLNVGGGGNAGIHLQARTATGALYWSQPISPMPYDAISDMALDANGNLLVLGTTYLTLGESALGGGDYFLLQADPATGQLQRIDQFGTGRLDWARRLLVDGNRRIVLGDESDGAWPWSLAIRVLAADGSETARMERTFGQSSQVQGAALAPGGIFVTGNHQPQTGPERGYVAFLQL